MTTARADGRELFRAGCATLLLTMAAGQAWADEPSTAVAEVMVEMESDPRGVPDMDAPAVETPSPDAAPSEPAEPDRDIHLSFGVDYTNAYYFRGIVQEDHAFILQPYATLTLDLWEHDDFTLTGSVGTWNSFHDSPTNAGNTGEFTENWYEADFIAAFGLAIDKFSFAAQYIWYTSPSDSFETVTEFDFIASYDDSELLGAWKLSPSVLLAVETGDDFADGADAEQGVYLQASISPGFSVKLCEEADLSINFPISAGFSLSDYYEDADGDDDAFGFFSVGVKASVPLPIPESYGSWTFSASATALILGDHTAEYNDDRDTEFVATVGISGSF